MEAIIKFLREEWGELIKAPTSFATLTVLCLGLGFSAGMLYYNSQIGALREQINVKDGQLNAKDGQLSRYRVALGIDPASKGALIELNNQELGLKAQSIVAELRKYSFALDEKEKVRRSLLDAKKIDKKQAFDQAMADLQVVSNAFDSNLASDTYNVENELRKRMDPAAIAHIPRVPALVFPGGTRVTFPALMRNSGLDADFIRPLTDEIEQMADLLPPDSAKH